MRAGYLDTDMAAAITTPKTAPDEVVRQVLAALRDGEQEVLVDEVSRAVKAGLSGPPRPVG